VADYYADSSALVKRHVNEIGTAWFQALADPAAGNVIVTARLSMVEVYSAFNRRLRETQISATDYTQIVNDFTANCSDYEWVELTHTVVERARLILERYPLRAYDAMQLASALVANDILQRANLSTLTFLSADNRLLGAAQIEGLATENPNAYP
jgi:hypothetical protein